MTRLSLRYSYALSACLALTLVPVLVHSYLDFRVDDCRNVRLLIPEAPPTSSAEKRNAWMQQTFQSSQWNEGYFVRDGVRFDFTIIRSYDAKALYHRPENYFAERAFVKRREVEWVSTSLGKLPIHRTYYGDSDPGTLVAYLLIYHSAPIANPYWAQFRAAQVELFNGRSPMTLVLIRAHVSPVGFVTAETTARGVVLAAWRNYLSTCTD